MATPTANYGLVKPESFDLYDVGVFNQNMDKIDTTMKTIKNEVFPLGGLYSGDMNELVNPGQYRLLENANLPVKGYYGQCFVGRGQAGADTASQMVISYACKQLFFRGGQYKNGVWTWENWSEVYSTNYRPSFNAISWLGFNPITTTTNDTTVKWTELGSGFAQFNKNGQLVDQPSQYGFIETYTYASDVFQVWRCLPGGATYQRSGNSGGWVGTWAKIYDSVNKPSLADIGIVVSENEPAHKTGQIWLKPMD